MLEQWMKSYGPEELFDAEGKLIAPLQELPPKGNRRMGANPHANGGQLLRELILPEIRDYALEVQKPSAQRPDATRVQQNVLRAVISLNAKRNTYRVCDPDETDSNRLGPWCDVTSELILGP